MKINKTNLTEPKIQKGPACLPSSHISRALQRMTLKLRSLVTVGLRGLSV